MISIVSNWKQFQPENLQHISTQAILMWVHSCFVLKTKQTMLLWFLFNIPCRSWKLKCKKYVNQLATCLLLQGYSEQRKYIASQGTNNYLALFCQVRKECNTLLQRIRTQQAPWKYQLVSVIQLRNYWTFNYNLWTIDYNTQTM